MCRQHYSVQQLQQQSKAATSHSSQHDAFVMPSHTAPPSLPIPTISTGIEHIAFQATTCWANLVRGAPLKQMLRAQLLGSCGSAGAARQGVQLKRCERMRQPTLPCLKAPVAIQSCNFPQSSGHSQASRVQRLRALLKATCS